MNNKYPGYCIRCDKYVGSDFRQVVKIFHGIAGANFLREIDEGKGSEVASRVRDYASQMGS